MTCQNIQEVIDYVLAGNSYGVIPYKKVSRAIFRNITKS